MTRLSSALRAAVLALTGLVAAGAASAQEQVLNLYSARHYQTDEALYANFTKATGIRIQRVDADDAGILARLKSEGAPSPADVILLVDAARLWRAETDGLFHVRGRNWHAWPEVYFPRLTTTRSVSKEVSRSVTLAVPWSSRALPAGAAASSVASMTAICTGAPGAPENGPAGRHRDAPPEDPTRWGPTSSPAPGRGGGSGRTR